ncbi:WGR domain-containing protein [Deinococcus hopiensis]|uniref:WGR domain-containing protein, predicted DNA-binding domain in MolR n=1 Tax=Deinococcus hopiensis KR-140 TaxID=695939 RepID=A0A1W1UP10_9DEIO|nr:WGR domain-containing protein [Deinococcus hopiensis]SMB82816.1 WGR domain-containing protein, predicted DNA-binding domain in MolR [Deinococcus hopiensis KR-140]
MERIYLEYSDPNGAEHKFYEVSVSGAELTARYGRIGTDGQKQVKTFPTPQKAEAEALKKAAEKRRKGYADAVEGTTPKRGVMRRTITEGKATTKKSAPVLWRFQSGAMAFGVFVDADRAWVGNERGEVYGLTLEGEPDLKFKLPDGVKCLVRDGQWTFAGCDDGNVYDLSGKLPFVAYEVTAGAALLWLDIHKGMLGVSDSAGSVYAFDAESDQQWGNVDQKGSMGWMVRVDDQGVYYGHSKGVGMFDRTTGVSLWEKSTRGGVLFGWQEGASVYAGTTANLVQRFSKAGVHEADYACDGTILSCATSPKGEYVFAGDSSGALYCFAQDGTRLWKLGSGCGSALSMQYAQQRLYIVTSQGFLAAVDASEAAIQAAQQGVTPQVRDVKMAAALEVRAPQTALPVTAEAGGRVVLVCVRDGVKLRVQPVGGGFQAWNVQFPRDLREEGARYVVDGLLDAGGFYRVVGEIRRLSA